MFLKILLTRYLHPSLFTWIWLRLAVEGDKGHAEQDTGQVEQHAQTQRSPEPVQRVDDLVADAHDRGVDAVRDGSAIADLED